MFYEVVVAPGYEPEALEILQRKRNLRVLSVGPTDSSSAPRPYDVRPLTGGMLVQAHDTLDEDPSKWKTATQRAPTPAELEDLAFAWTAAKHVKSNAIVLAKDKTLVGMGAGQPNRVVSVHLAQRAAGDRSKGSVLASDAFFPSPTTSSWPPKPASLPSSSPAGPFTTTRSSPPPTSTTSPWFSPESGTSVTEVRDDNTSPLNPGTPSRRPRVGASPLIEPHDPGR